MRPLPPRSATSETSAVSELQCRRSLEDAPPYLLARHSLGNSHSLRQGGEPSAAARRDRQAAEAAAELASGLQGQSGDSSGVSSRDATRHGQQQLSSCVENDAERCERAPSPRAVHCNCLQPLKRREAP